MTTALDSCFSGRLCSGAYSVKHNSNVFTAGRAHNRLPYSFCPRQSGVLILPANWSSLPFDRYVKAILAKHSFTCYSSLANKRTHRHVWKARFYKYLLKHSNIRRSLLRAALSTLHTNLLQGRAGARRAEARQLTYATAGN